MKLYAGCDLHSTNNYLGIVDQDGKKLFSKKIPNNPDKILKIIAPFKRDMELVAVESTYNWYWMVDLLKAEGYPVVLANPAAMQKYKGLKHSDDKHDAFWLADMMRLNILPQGYIYPKEERPTRDLCRKRLHLVRLRTNIILSLQSMITRNTGQRISGQKLKSMSQEAIVQLVSFHEDLEIRAATDKVALDNLGRQIKHLETVLNGKAKPKPEYKNLLTIPGSGPTLSLTIMLETGPVSRFREVGNYASYCRKVDSKWTSNNKTKGKGNKRNGNKYLAWAFSEVAEHARRVDQMAKRFFERKSPRLTVWWHMVHWLTR